MLFAIRTPVQPVWTYTSKKIMCMIGLFQLLKKKVFSLYCIYIVKLGLFFIQNNDFILKKFFLICLDLHVQKIPFFPNL